MPTESHGRIECFTHGRQVQQAARDVLRPYSLDM
jgi:hypothetical protein